MGRKNKSGGVTPRGKWIQITFPYLGERCRETLKRPPTPPNIAHAKRLRQEIMEKIDHGTFKYADYFPESQRAEKPTAKPTFRALGAAYLKTLTDLAFSTVEGYDHLLELHVYPTLGDKPIDTITYLDLTGIIPDGITGKTRNNLLTPIRAVMDLALVEGHITANPALRLRNAKVQDPEPDPFDLAEVELILEHIGGKYGEPVECYFGLGFFAGPRVSEHIELSWKDVDWRRSILRVQRAKVRRKKKDTKTGRARNHELNSRARAYLERQRKHTQLAKIEGDPIFVDPITGNPYIDDQTPRRRYWEPTLKALGIRYREPKQMRHTYATTAIMAGANPNWIAKQMGNSPRVMYKHYARWIEDADKGRQQQKLEAFLVANPVANDRGPAVSSGGK